MDRASSRQLRVRLTLMLRGNDKAIKQTLTRELAILWKYYKLKRHRRQRN